MKSTTPVLIANPRPFRLVLRDADDNWSPTIEQINGSDYDYVKLHRATKFFDAEIAAPFPVCVAFDGSFILPAVSTYKAVDATLDEFNRIFASILLGGVYTESVEPEDLSQGEMTKCGYFRHTITHGGNGELHKALGNKDASSGDAICLMAPPTVLASELEAAYLIGARVLKAASNLSSALLVTAFTYYLKRQTKESLSHAWICIEQLLDHIWRAGVIDEAKSSQIAKRRKFLESQQWSSAHKIELLYQKQVITDKVYEKLSVCRDARNHFIHRGEAPSHLQAKSALDGLVDLLKYVAGQASVSFEDAAVRGYLEPPASGLPRTMVTKAENLDWKGAQYWKAVPFIPGDEKWEGEFEQFDDITLQPVKPHTGEG